MQKPLFCCASCDSVKLVDLRVCIHCCTITCSSCIIISNEAHVKKKLKQRKLVDEVVREVQLSKCRSCRRPAGLLSLLDASIGVAQLFKATARNDTVTLECIVCGAPPFRNRICPHCGIILCSSCFDAWHQRCRGSEKEDMFSCVHCRQTCGADQYVHDRFIAKIAHGRCQRDQKSPKSQKSHIAETTSTLHIENSKPSTYYTFARIICGFAIIIFIAISSCLQQGFAVSKNNFGSRFGLQQLVSQEAGALQEWLANEGARSLYHCENEVPDSVHNLPWGLFACAWAPGSQAIHDRWKLIRRELFAIAGVRMGTVPTKEVLGALYAVEVRLMMQKPKAYEHFFHAMLSIGGPFEKQSFERVVQLAPNFSYASLYLALGQAKRGKMQKALVHANNCLAKNPTNIECELLKFKIMDQLQMPIEGELWNERVFNCRRAMDDTGTEPNFTYMLRGYTALSDDKGVIGWMSSRFASLATAMHDA